MDLETVLKNQVDSVVKFVTGLYSPEDYWVKEYDNPKRYSLIFYFDDIDDNYILNPDAGNIRAHKENMLRREIRKSIQDFFGIKTSGLQPPNYFSPEENYPISIFVRHTQ